MSFPSLEAYTTKIQHSRLGPPTRWCFRLSNVVWFVDQFTAGLTQDEPATRELRKTELGQFMTPSPVAEFMAERFDKNRMTNVSLIDAGAGQGALSIAFAERPLLKRPLTVASRLSVGGSRCTTGCGGDRHLTRGYRMPSRRNSNVDESQ